ncbi:glycosyltransferase family 2 protein, partial [Streptococcus suis]
SDNSTMIKDAIRSITEFSTYPNYEIIVVTNSRVIEELSFFEIDNNIRYFTYDKPFNFSDKCNAGASLASGEVLIFYNDDVRVITREWMEHTLDAFNLHNVGAVGVKL